MALGGRLRAAGLSIAVLASLASPVHAVAAASGGTSTGDPGLPCASPLLADPVGGAAAIKELGADLPKAAAKIERSPAEFRALLRSDPTMRVDECGQTFVVEPAMTSAEKAAAASADDTPVASPTLSTSGDAFALNSRPGSLRTIYLDFDGQEVVGTMWNDVHADVVAPPYDTDGNPAFSTAERAAISSIWLRVAEDYAPFDVNVTTQDPGQDALTRNDMTDELYGTRALITMDAVLYADQCGTGGCGGIAAVGVFDLPSSHDYYQPALVFQRGLGGASATAKTIAEAVSHEVGHNLGLSHDGHGPDDYYLGQGVWAPIMGVGYYRPLTQWSKGEYAQATRQEDDLVIIASHGPSLLVDDHANSATGATTLAYAGPAVDGLIGTRTDTDWFTFTVPTGAGATAVRVTPQTVGGDLDASVTVYDGAGSLVMAANPSVASTDWDQITGLAATLVSTLAPGTYRARVDGVGYGSVATTGYTDYASLGRYTISAGGTTSAPTALPSTWTGTLGAAVSALTVRSETGAGYSATRFPLVDADHDCRNIRAEVLKSESLSQVRWKNARRCVVVHGQWYSTFDRRTVKWASNTSVVWMVPLSEAWQSGARAWSTARRQAYANDLADSRTLRAVSTTSAKARANREPTRWLPASASRCTYVAEWVAVKLRWGLAINSAERTRLASLAAGCSGTRLTVHRT